MRKFFQITTCAVTPALLAIVAALTIARAGEASVGLPVAEGESRAVTGGCDYIRTGAVNVGCGLGHLIAGGKGIGAGAATTYSPNGGYASVSKKCICNGTVSGASKCSGTYYY